MVTMAMANMVWSFIDFLRKTLERGLLFPPPVMPAVPSITADAPFMAKLK
jgi:hypothetical protein